MAALVWAAPNSARAGIDPAILDKKPKLVVAIVVDQLRADHLTKNRARFLPAKGAKGALGGFRYLTDLGSYYPVAQYQVLYALTAPDHATIATGAYPYRHGIVANRFYDRRLRRRRYCVDDPRYRVIGGSPQAVARGIGPSNLRGPTLGDALKNNGYGDAKVVSI